MRQHQSDSPTGFILPAAGVSGIVIGLIPAAAGGAALYLLFIGLSNNAPTGPLLALGVFGAGLLLVAAFVLRGALVPPAVVTRRAMRVHTTLGTRRHILTDQSVFGWVPVTRRSTVNKSDLEPNARRRYGRLFVKHPGQTPREVCFLPEPQMQSLVSGIRATTGLPVRKMPIGGQGFRGQPDPAEWDKET